MVFVFSFVLALSSCSSGYRGHELFECDFDSQANQPNLISTEEEWALSEMYKCNVGLYKGELDYLDVEFYYNKAIRCDMGRVGDFGTNLVIVDPEMIGGGSYHRDITLEPVSKSDRIYLCKYANSDSKVNVSLQVRKK